MTAALVRHHKAGTSTNGGSLTPAQVLTAPVVAGNLVVAAFTLDLSSGAHAVTAISKPVGETANWTKLASYTPSGSSGACGELWAIRPETSWAVGTNITATTSQPSVRRAYTLSEFTGVTSGVRAAAGTGTSTSDAPSATATGGLAGDLVIGAAALWNDVNHSPSPDTDTTNGAWSASAYAYGGGQDFQDSAVAILQYKVLTAAGDQTYNPSVALTKRAGAAAVALVPVNDPPNAPTLLSPATGVTINRNVTQRFRWGFSDPNPSDSQSAATYYYRVVGDTTWTTLTVGSPSEYVDVPGGTFAAADYEWTASTLDSFGAAGPAAPSEFFTAGDPPAGPTITSPTSGSTITLPADDMEWSTPAQDSYQARKVADDGTGSPDTATVYFDTGEVADPAARKVTFAFDVNNRAEHLQLRTKLDSLWSDWVDDPVDVSYTPPPTPTVELTADPVTGSLLVTITNPAPGEDEPAAAYNEVWIDDGDGEERKATGCPPNSDYRYWTPVSGRDYSAAVRVVAFGSNGTSSST